MGARLRWVILFPFKTQEVPCDYPSRHMGTVWLLMILSMIHETLYMGGENGYSLGSMSVLVYWEILVRSSTGLTASSGSISLIVHGQIEISLKELIFLA